MFGQQNNNDDNQQIPAQSIDGVMSDAPADQQADAPAADAPATQDDNQQAADQNGGNSAEEWQHPGTPLDPEQAEAVAAAVEKPSYDSAQPAEPTYATNDLVDIKQQALQQLSPLVTHLDQGPEDRFRTLMMMIQASDDQTLVKDAYEAANQIEDEKAKAQALLDIVNEINYFTTQHHDA